MGPDCIGMELWLIGMLAHVAWWRVKVPRHPYQCLLILFGLIGFVGAFVLRLVWIPSEEVMGGVWGILYALNSYVSFSFAYIVTYSAIEQDSPTATIARYVELAGPMGRIRHDFDRLVSQSDLVQDRIDAMIDAGLVRPSGVRLCLTWKGKLFHLVLGCWRRVLNVRVGG